MSGSSRDRLAPSQRWATVLAVVGAALVALFVAAAVLVAVPPTVANLASTVSQGDEPITLETPAATAGVVVPEGWLVTRAGEDGLVVLSPDGVLRVRMTLTDGTPLDVVIATDDRAGEPRSETLASGLAVVHSDLDDAGIVAAVAVPGGVVRVQSELIPPAGDVDPNAYRPAFAQVLDGILP
ncbi:hypothetical protein GCM10022200_13870 [Microbacterium awajiense]|uniref:Uncharacterized protein n=1 Tax=Microbacterium awajiense TaxID=415214 RepID=A0ABP7AGW6_9MICO